MSIIANPTLLSNVPPHRRWALQLISPSAFGRTLAASEEADAPPAAPPATPSREDELPALPPSPESLESSAATRYEAA